MQHKYRVTFIGANQLDTKPVQHTINVIANSMRDAVNIVEKNFYYVKDVQATRNAKVS